MFDKLRKLIEDNSCDEGLKQLEYMIPLSVGRKYSEYAIRLEASMEELLEGIYYCGFNDGHMQGKKAGYKQKYNPQDTNIDMNH